MTMKFYRCTHCGQIITIVNDTGVPVVCCGKAMEELIPGTVDASIEKHIPVYEVRNGIVNVNIGSVGHPMTPDHYIEWIAVQTKNGNQRKALKPGDEPKASFALLGDDEVVAVYAYCNLHRLWKRQH